MNALIPHSRPSIAAADLDAVSACLVRGMVAEGPLAARAAHALAAHWHMRSATLAGSGTQALVLALKALDVTAGSEVICPDYVCPEVWGAIQALGASVVLVDIGDDYFADLAQVTRAISNRTRAVVLPFLMGLYRDVAPFRALGVPLIADCAQFALPADTLLRIDADVIVLSFEGTKMLTSGEGGAVLTDSAELAARLSGEKRLRATPYKFNAYPLSDLQAALLLSQLERLDEFLRRRRALAMRYRSTLQLPVGITQPAWDASDSCFFRYPLRLPDSRAGQLDTLIERAGMRGVALRRPVDTLLHRFQDGQEAFPRSEMAWSQTLSIPIYPTLSDDEQTTVIDLVNELLNAEPAAGGR